MREGKGFEKRKEITARESHRMIHLFPFEEIRIRNISEQDEERIDNNITSTDTRILFSWLRKRVRERLRKKKTLRMI